MANVFQRVNGGISRLHGSQAAVEMHSRTQGPQPPTGNEHWVAPKQNRSPRTCSCLWGCDEETEDRRERRLTWESPGL